MKNKNRNIIVCWNTRDRKKDMKVSELCLDFGLQIKQKHVSLGECCLQDTKVLRFKLKNLLKNKTDTFDVFTVHLERDSEIQKSRSVLII